MPKRPRVQPTSRPSARRRAAVLSVEAVEARVLLATLTVNTVADDTTPDGTLSLREAIAVANGTLALNALSAQEQGQVVGALSIPNTIAFRIPGPGVHTILVNAPLPPITRGLIIDGYTEQGASPNTLATADNAALRVQLSGIRQFSGLQIQADQCLVRGLAIVGFTNAIAINAGVGSRIEGNFLGTDTSGEAGPGNLGYGVAVSAVGNVIGGPTPAQRNVIAANGSGGILVSSESTAGASGNAIEGNFIGIGASGTTRLGNGGDGVNVQFGGTGTTIGGATPGRRNVVSGNTGSGVSIATTGTTVQGNLIGTNASGVLAVGNTLDGVSLFSSGSSSNASNNLIGGTGPGLGNVLSGNFRDGIGIASFSISSGRVADATGNVIQGNRIGVDDSGKRPVGNGRDGVRISGASGNLIGVGGTLLDGFNIIGGNLQDGVEVVGSLNTSDSSPIDAPRNQIRLNFIGTDTEASLALSNGRDGVRISRANNNVILGNSIAFNLANGVTIGASLAEQVTGNVIDVNGIFGNARLGIDLGNDGVTPNLPGGPNAGPNPRQNFPVLTASTVVGDRLVVTGTLDSPPNQAFTIQLFGNPALDPTGYGQGRRFLGTTIATTDRLGFATFQISVSAALAAGQSLSATATDSRGNTSEFSRDLAAASISTLAFSAPTYTVNAVGGPVFATVNVIRNGATDRQVRVNFATSDGDATAGVDYVATSVTLTFAPGEVSKTVQIPILDTLLLSGTRRFVVALSAPADGSQLGPQATAVVTIVEANNLVVTTTADDGVGSLRRAINLVNNPQNTGPFAITFAIPGTGARMIRPATALPIIVAPVSIDGYTQPGSRPNGRAVGDDAAMAILLDGSLLPRGGADSGLVFAASGNVVQGLAIGGFPVAGIVLEAGVGSRIRGNFLGTDASGTRALPNGKDGIFLVDSSYNLIGGTTPGERNIISGNGSVGVVIQGNAPLSDGLPTAAAISNVLVNNYIGTDASGLAPLGNAQDGVFLVDASGNSVGLAAAMAGNLISGNGSVGVQILGAGASGNQVLGNAIGLDATGRRRLGNVNDGIFLDRASGTLIGGSVPGAGNVVAGNGSVGVQVAGSGASGNVIQGNLIGTNSLGEAGLGNRRDGVFLNQAPGNLLGGALPGQGNFVSGNGFSGIEIVRATGNVVQGNLNGLAPGGGALGNGGYGVLIQNASGNTIGGAGSARNTIMFNRFDGIQVLRNGQPLASPGGSGNAISGNLLGGNNRLNGAAGAAPTPGPHPKGARQHGLLGSRGPRRRG